MLNGPLHRHVSIMHGDVTVRVQRAAQHEAGCQVCTSALALKPCTKGLHAWTHAKLVSGLPLAITI